MLTDTIKQSILDDYHANYPRECCGFIIDDRYVPVPNISPNLGEFEIDTLDYLRCSKMGQIRALIHSHPDGVIDLSQADKVQMQAYSYPWVVTNGIDFAVHEPKPYKLPLLGREYHHGLIDCYTIWRDYYERELGITMSDYERTDNWWNDQNHEPLYLSNYEQEGFVQVDTLRKHDVILCRVGRTEHVNHALIFVGDGKLKSEQTTPVIGDSLVLHHPYNRQSIREIYGQQWQSRTVLIIRHRSML